MGRRNSDIFSGKVQKSKEEHCSDQSLTVFFSSNTFLSFDSVQCHCNDGKILLQINNYLIYKAIKNVKINYLDHNSNPTPKYSMPMSF